MEGKKEEKGRGAYRDDAPNQNAKYATEPTAALQWSSVIDETSVRSKNRRTN